MKPKKACAQCGMVKNNSVHLYGHDFVDPRPAGISPVGQRERPGAGQRFKMSDEGKWYEATKQANQGKPCEMRDFLGEAAWFEAGMQLICSKVGEHLHEILSRGRAGGIAAALRDGPRPLWLCDSCNSHVSTHPAWAKEHDLLMSQKDIR